MLGNVSSSGQEPGLWTQTGWRQIRYTVAACAIELSIGMAFGFAAVMGPQIAASEIEVTSKQGAWLVSIVYLLLPLGNLINGFVMDCWGRRVALAIGPVPLFVGWLYTGLAENVSNIIIGRAITGFGCGMATAPPRVYIAEISLPNLRGLLGSISPLTTSLGITLQSFFGSWFPWHTVCFGCAGYTAGVFCLTLFLPETPYFLMKKFRPTDEIERSLRKFRGSNYNLDIELDAMEDFRNTNSIRRMSICREILELFTIPVCHPFMIITIYILIAQMSGIAILVQWTVTILNESKVAVNSHAATFVMSGSRFITLILMVALLYYCPRKVLAITSSMGVGVSCLLIFFHLVYSTGPHAYPMLLFVSYMFFSTLGFYCLPFIIMTEIYPLQVRGVLGGITLGYTNVLSFVFTKYYLDLHTAIGLSKIFLIFSISCFVGSVFLIFFLPETKGLTLQEIEEYFNRTRPTLVSTQAVMSAQQLSREQIERSKTQITGSKNR